MGIDGIGKPPPPIPPAPSADSATVGPGNVESFSLRTSEGTTPVEGTHSALDQLRAGAINLQDYLDIKVHEATAGLGNLAPSQLEGVRKALRERLSVDPTFVELLRRATGAVEVPEPSLKD